MGIDIDSSNFDGVLAAFHERVKERRRFAVLIAAEQVMWKAQELAPVETGHLRASADVQPKGPSTAWIYFPGPYARYQHFGLDFHHEEGQALYLEQAMITEADEAFKVMADVLGS